MMAFPQPAQKEIFLLFPLLPCRILSKLLKELHQANSSFPPVQREILGVDKDRKKEKKRASGRSYMPPPSDYTDRNSSYAPILISLCSRIVQVPVIDRDLSLRAGSLLGMLAKC